MLLAGSTLLCFVVVEGWLRVADRQRHPHEFSRVSLNGKVYPLLNTRTSFSGKARRVAIVGDSFVAGVRCGNNHNLPGHYARLAGAAVQVDNLGFTAAQPYDYVDVVDNYIKQAGSPAVLHVLYYSNDNAMSWSLCRHRPAMAASGYFSGAELKRVEAFCAGSNFRSATAAARPRGGDLHSFLSYSKTYLLMRELAARLLAKSGADRNLGRARFYAWWEDPGSLQTRLALFSMKLLQDRARKHGARLVLGFYPNVEFLSRASRLHAAYEGVIRVARRDLGLEVFNGYDVFLASPSHERDMSLSLLDPHPRCEAHEIMARHLLRLAASR